MQIAQNKCICFCLKLDKIHHRSSQQLGSINWLFVYKRVDQCIIAVTFKLVINICHYYLNQVYECIPHCRIESKSNFSKLKVPFGKTNIEQKGLSYTGPSLWINLHGSMKKTTVLNTFKHNMKKLYLTNLSVS